MMSVTLRNFSTGKINNVLSASSLTLKVDQGKQIQQIPPMRSTRVVHPLRNTWSRRMQQAWTLSHIAPVASEVSFLTALVRCLPSAPSSIPAGCCSARTRCSAPRALDQTTKQSINSAAHSLCTTGKYAYDFWMGSMIETFQEEEMHFVFSSTVTGKQFFLFCFSQGVLTRHSLHSSKRQLEHQAQGHLSSSTSSCYSNGEWSFVLFFSRCAALL